MNSIKTFLIFCLALAFTLNSCKKDNTTDPCEAPCNGQSSISWGGDTYQLVEIGCQCWFAENLRYSGSIPLVTQTTSWNSNTTGAWCYYNSNPDNIALYGNLYNWYAVNTGKLCPPGWHIPDNEDWNGLIDYLGGENQAGGKMKSTTGWNPPNLHATNESGFSGLPGGTRAVFNSYHGFGSFDRVGLNGYWWSSTEVNYQAANQLLLSSNSGTVRIENGHKTFGASCRCLRD